MNQTLDEREAAREADRRERAAEEHRRLVTLRLTQLEVPPIYASVSFENFELHGEPDDQLAQVRALTLARRYLVEWPDVRNDILIFRGGVGSGKGHIAWTLARLLTIGHCIRARSVNLADLVRRLRASWKRNA